MNSAFTTVDCRALRTGDAKRSDLIHDGVDPPTLTPEPCTLHPAPCTLNLHPESRNPQNHGPDAKCADLTHNGVASSPLNPQFVSPRTSNTSQLLTLPGGLIVTTLMQAWTAAAGQALDFKLMCRDRSYI